MTDYPAFGKIPRLHRPVVVTEKIDGTNALVSIQRQPFGTYGAAFMADTDRALVSLIDNTVIDDAGMPVWEYNIRAGSRNRWLTREADNYGFAAWVWANAGSLVALGEGRHYGEWFGRGIQRGYGLPDRRFGLFNVARWYDAREEDVDAYREMMPTAQPCPDVCTVVPILHNGTGDKLNSGVKGALTMLRVAGSFMVNGYRDPEGVIVFHLAAGQYFKVLIENDDKAKGAA